MANRAVLQTASRVYQIVEEINRRLMHRSSKVSGNEEKYARWHYL